MPIESIFQALASTVRRKILAFQSEGELTAGDIADRFNMTKPSISKHLSILEAANLIKGDKRGQFIYYSLVRDNLVNTLDGFVQEICPIRRPLKKESQARKKAKNTAR